MLYALPAAAAAVAWAATYWRCLALRRALNRERAEARLVADAWARDVAALEQQVRAERARASRERAVLAQAAAVVDAELAAAGSDLPRGSTDG